MPRVGGSRLALVGLVLASLLAVGLWTAPRPAHASGCSVETMWILGYGYTPNPVDNSNFLNSTNGLDTCWHGNGGVSFRPLPNDLDCQYNASPKGVQTSTAAFYDDTSYNHTSPTDGSSMTNCWQSYDSNWVSGKFAGEYMAPKSSSCTTQCWKEVVPSGLSVSNYFTELYSSNSNVGNMFSNWTGSTQSGLNPNTTAGVINLSPYGTWVTSGQGTGIENWVEQLCSATSGGMPMSVYSSNNLVSSNYKIDQQNGGQYSVEYYLVKGMNACD
jgi:hypothetical protein